MSLSVKLSLSVLGGIFGLLGLLGYLGFSVVAESTDRTMDERLAVARLIAHDIENDTLERLLQLQDSAALIAPDLEAGRLDAAQAQLEQLQRVSGQYARAVFVVDAEGKSLLSVPASAPDDAAAPASYPNVRRSLDAGEQAVSATVPDPAGQSPLISLSVPVTAESGEALGVLGLALAPGSDYLRSLLPPVGLGRTSYAQVVNEEGAVVASNAPAGQNGEFQVTAHEDRFARLIRNGEEGIWTCHRCHEPEGEDGRRKEDLMAFAPLSTIPWAVAIRQDKDEALSPRSDLRDMFLISGAAALLAGLAAALVIGRALSRPLRRLTAASHRIATGDLEHPIDVPGRDEVGQLGAAFETMRRALKQSNRELEERSRALAALEERERLARELHDNLSQTLSYIRLSVAGSKERLERGELEGMAEQLDDIRQAARDAYEDVRQDISALRSGGRLEQGLEPALQEFLERYRTQTGLDVRLDLNGAGPLALSQAAQVQALRILQEALANVRKHAQATAVRIACRRRGSRVEITVEDNGRGFDPEAVAANGPHYGIQIMKERAESAGGTMHLFSHPGRSTRLVVSFPASNTKENTWNR